MIGSMLLCFSAALVGVLIFIRRRSLIGETLSHATYPGVTIAVAIAPFFHAMDWLNMWIIVGAFVSALSGYFLLNFLQFRLKLSSDAALCFVLAALFGIGMTIASYVQNLHPQAFRQIQAYLYGQTATMTDSVILGYSCFSAIVVFFLWFFHKELKAIAFDRSFAKSINMPVGWIELMTLVLIVFTVVLSIRSAGVVLMSAMLIAPAVAARQWTSHLSKMLGVAGGIGLLSGLLGNYFSVIGPQLFQGVEVTRISIPTGPMIVLVAASAAVFSLFFAPERGLVVRSYRILRFRMKCAQENFIKELWRHAEKGKKTIPLSSLFTQQSLPRLFFWICTIRFRLKSWITFTENNECLLTSRGEQEGRRIVRLHRLWEAYLVNCLGMGIERVHQTAEEMEHVLTPEIEKQLVEILDHPLHDPHSQPIPSSEGIING